MDEIYSLDTLYVCDDVPEELYELVRQGLYSQLENRLHELPNSIEYLTTTTFHGQGRLTLLMVAAMNGYDDVVRLLLTHCDPIQQIELNGTIKLSDKEKIDGATALYCACYEEHFTVAKTLIELGKANVDEDTYDYPCYPLLLHAIMMNRINIVRFLIENGYSNVNETKSIDDDQRTSLICAASCGNITLIKYLIDHGAEVNYICKDEKLSVLTPFSSAIVNGHAEAAQLLYEAGANTTFESHFISEFLRIAIEKRYYSIIRFLSERLMCTVEDLEFAASSLIDVIFTPEQMHEVFELLKLALQERELMNLPKVCMQPIAVYDYAQECQTVDEFDIIKTDHNRILIETLLIRERIFLVRQDLTIINPLYDYGDTLAERNEFDKCFDVWIHIFSLSQQIEMATILQRFIWLFCKMITANQRISVERFLQACRLIFQPFPIENKDIILVSVLCLVVIATKILEQVGVSEEEQKSIYCLIRDFCRHQLTTTDGRTLLHFCVDQNITQYLHFQRTDIIPHVPFPNESALRLLLTCGRHWFDIDAIESSNGDTPLHIICQSTGDQQIIKLLLDSGCHIDCVNKYGIGPMSYIGDESMRILFMPTPTPRNLKCLCARIIAINQLNTESLKVLRSTLKQFITLHGGNLYTQSSCN